MREKVLLYGLTECDNGYSFGRCFKRLYMPSPMFLELISSKVVVLSDPLLYEAEPKGIYLRQSDQLPKYRQGITKVTKLPQRKQISTRSALMAALFRSGKQMHENVRDTVVKSIEPSSGFPSRCSRRVVYIPVLNGFYAFSTARIIISVYGRSTE
jgi:hypothetical protein